MKTNLVKKIVAGVMAAAIAVGAMMAGSVDAQAAKKKDTFKEYDGYYGEVVKAVRTAPKTVEVYVKQLGPKSLAKSLKKADVEVSYYDGKGDDQYFEKKVSFKKVSKNMYKGIIKDVELDQIKKAEVRVMQFRSSSRGTYRFVGGSKVVKAAKNIKWKKVCIKKARTYVGWEDGEWSDEFGGYIRKKVKKTEPAEYAYRWVKVK